MKHFSMAVINHILTSIGGSYEGSNMEMTTNILVSLLGNSWMEIFPLMPTKRMNPAAANTPTHLHGGSRRKPKTT